MALKCIKYAVVSLVVISMAMFSGVLITADRAVGHFYFPFGGWYSAMYVFMVAVVWFLISKLNKMFNEMDHAIANK